MIHDLSARGGPAFGMRFLKYTVFFLFWGFNGFSQGGTARIYILAGGNVPFIFNTISKYKAGIPQIQYTDYTQIGLTVVDLPALPDLPGTWELNFKATTAGINSDGGSPALLLGTVRLVGAVSGFVDPDVVAYGTPLIPLPLTALDQKIAESAAMAVGEEPTSPTDRILITYDCGVAIPLLGSASDFYTVDIEFTFTVNF